MDKSIVKEILIKAKDTDLAQRRVKNMNCGRAYRKLKRTAQKAGKGELYSNFYLVEEAYSEVRGKKVSNDLRYFIGTVFPLIDVDTVSDVLSAFYEVVSDLLNSDECESVRRALLEYCIIGLAKGDDRCLELIRQVKIFDFTPFVLGFVKYEQILRRDAVYVAMDRESKSLYKEKIKKYARKRGLTFSEGCERLWEQASEKGCHIGELLPMQKGEKGWLLIPPIIFLLLMAVPFSLMVGEVQIPIMSLVLLLLSLPLWQTSFELFVPIVARFRKSEILPRIDMPKIPEESAVLTVITALGTNTSEVKQLFERLELLSLKTRSRGRDEYAFWGILLDLPQSVDEKADTSVIKAAKKEVDRLNSKSRGRFVLFTRDRVWDSVEGVFKAHERKRGAVIGLVKMLTDGESEVTAYGWQLPKIKYILTLDADTDMEPGALNKMVGTLEHPLNRPKVGERKGVKVVTEGFGILQPATVTTLESVHKTAFSTLIGGSGGIDSYHSAIFNLNSVLFGKGIFCGKGMFDVDAFRETVCDAFPDGRILSHDILEGTRLSTGYMPDVCFFDAIPSNAVSFYNRSHRWARGDIQSLAFIGRNVDTPHGKKSNPMLFSERFVFATNAVNLAVPVFQVLGLFFIMGYGGILNAVSFFFLLPCFIPLVNEILRSSFHGSFKNILRRFFGDTLTAICRESIMPGYRMASLTFVAYRNTDATVRAVWRMKVSGKKLLEWTTASQGESVKSGITAMFIYTLPSFIAGVFMLIFARLPLCKLMGILWSIFFAILYGLNKKVSVKKISEKQRKTLMGYVADMWRYFERYADESNNYLPPDNVSVFPLSEVACRTSPTNIGLYLLSVLSALDLSLISVTDATDRLERAIDSIERLPKYRGQLYNWYSTVTLQVIGQEYISTVDSGNFITCLVALYQGLSEYEGKDKRLKDLRGRIKAIEEQTDFRFLFNSSRNLFALGFFADTEKQDSIMYDMYMSEARTTDYYAIARGIVRDSHWQHLSRPLITSVSGVGVLSWSGTCFEYFMPHLLLPLYKNSFAFEALSYAFSEQVKHYGICGGERVYGISESGYFAFDESLGYQYRAFGIPTLSRRVENGCQKVISPYSSFLMLPISASNVLKNLEALKKVGMYGEYGFYEALDITPSRVGNRPSIVKSFMSHHIGMSIVACVNAVKDGIFVKRFMSDIEMKAMSEFLREAVPADAMGVKKEKMQKHPEKRMTTRIEKKESAFMTQASTWALTGKESAAVFFERGVVSLDLTRKGERISALCPVDSTNRCAMYLFSCVGERVVSPSVSPDVSFSFDTNVCYRQNGLTTSISLSAKNCATRIRLESQGDSGTVGLYFEPLLTDFTAYASHPAFSQLFFRAEYTNGVLLLSRSGEKQFSLAVVSASPYSFEISKERIFDGVEYGFDALADYCKKQFSNTVDGILVSPCVFVKSEFKARTDTTFVIGWGRTKSEALLNAKEEIEMTESRSFRLSRELFYSAVTASGGEFDRNMSAELLKALRPSARLKFRNALPSVYGKGSVYALGISGKYPIFSVKKGVSEETLEKIFRTHKLHYVMGLRYELVVEIEDSGYARGGRAEICAMAERLQCGFLMGRSGGIHFADITSVSEETVDSLAVCSYPERDRIKRFRVREAVKTASDVKVSALGISGDAPSVQWYHIIATPVFGTVLSHRSLGNTWVYNSRLSRITYWENSNVGGKYSEKIYLEKDGIRKDLCASATDVRFSCGAAEYIGKHFNIRVTVHPTLLFKAVSVTVEDGDISLYYSFLPVLGDMPTPTGIEYSRDGKNSVKFANLFSESLTKGFGYIMMPFENEIFVDDGFGVHCERSGEAVFILGYAGSERHYEAVKRYFGTQRFSDLYTLYSGILQDRLRHEKNFAVAYQTLISRFYARSGPYQSGGAWGFRDQAQDCLTLIDISPETVRTHICRMAAHQYKEGDVQHWWHKGRGVRTHCSDDYLWLVWLVCMYIGRTKDKSVLGVEIAYLDSPMLSESEKDRYESPAKTVEKYTVLHHMTAALDLLLDRGLGEHSLPFILGGDWNDGMNMLPPGSESVWLGFFARIVIHMYTRLTGDEKYLGFSERIKRGIEENAFFSDRYARAFIPDGSVLGVEGSKYFDVDVLPQAFSSLCHSIVGDGVTSRITLALDTAWKSLYDGKTGIFKLFAPPLSAFDKSIGYLSSYPEGVRENGGQYTHAAAWMGLGCLYAPEKQEENRKRAETLADILYPAGQDSEVYKTEPYVLCGDVYTSGHGGWSWYTGSAAWYRELILRISDKNRNNLTPLA